MSIQVVRFVPRDGVSGTDRTRKRLGGTGDGAIGGLELVGPVIEKWGSKSVEARDGNVFLSIDYGAAPKQGADRIDSTRHQDGLRRVLEEAATALQSYKNY